MTCKDCIHNGVCYLQEVTNDIDEQLKEFGCDDFKNKADFIEVEHSDWVYDGKPIHCKRCGYSPEYSLNKKNSNYCPNCGVKMDGWMRIKRNDL